jgi:hypothetical protein
LAAIAPVLTAVGLDLANPLKTTDANVAASTTFAPEGFKQAGVAKWVNRSGGIAIGYSAFTQSIRPPTQASRIYKVTQKLVIPILEQTSPSTSTGIQPAPTKAYDLTCIMDWMLPERSTRTERLALFNYVQSLMFRTITASDGSPSTNTGSPVESAVLDFEDVY